MFVDCTVSRFLQCCFKAISQRASQDKFIAYKERFFGSSKNLPIILEKKIWQTENFLSLLHLFFFNRLRFLSRERRKEAGKQEYLLAYHVPTLKSKQKKIRPVQNYVSTHVAHVYWILFRALNHRFLAVGMNMSSEIALFPKCLRLMARFWNARSFSWWFNRCGETEKLGGWYFPFRLQCGGGQTSLFCDKNWTQLSGFFLCSWDFVWRRCVLRFYFYARQKRDNHSHNWVGLRNGIDSCDKVLGSLTTYPLDLNKTRTIPPHPVAFKTPKCVGIIDSGVLAMFYSGAKWKREHFVRKFWHQIHGNICFSRFA